MRRKLLSVVLCVCMMMTMAPFAFAAGETALTASSAVLTSGTYILKNDVTLTSGALTIPENATVTIELNGKKLTNKNGNHTIINNGTLIITGSGTVDNVSNGTAALYNNAGATATLNGGTYTRSHEAGQDKDTSGGNSYYTLKNFGTMTINSGVTVKQDGTDNGGTTGKYSSLVANGWYDASKNGSNGEPTPTAEAALTINGGTFSGGLNTIKNDDYGTLTINDGLFKNYAQCAFFNANVATINGGTFVNEGTRGVIYTYAKWNKNYGQGILNINGGVFVTAGTSIIEKDKDAASINITGGVFSSEIPGSTAKGSLYVYPSANPVAEIGDFEFSNVADAIYASETNDTVTLLKDVTESVVIPAGKTVTLDLNGNTISAPTNRNYDAIVNNGTLTVTDSQKTGKIISTKNAGIGIYENSTTTIEYANISGQEGAIGGRKTTVGANLTINNGVFEGVDNAVVIFNGSNRQGEPNNITINGGIFNGKIQSTGYVACGIYAPWKDNITVNDGTFNITCGAGIVARAGTVTVKGGEFNTTGDVTGQVGDSRVVVPCSALVFDSEATYPGMSDDSKIVVDGGKFKSAVDTIAVVKNDEDTNSRIVVNGGYFTTDPSAYCVTGKTGIASDLSGYAYMVGTKSTTSKIPATVDSATVEAGVSDSVPQDKADDVQSAANSMTAGASATGSDLEAVVKSKSDANTITSDQAVANNAVTSYNNGLSAENDKLTSSNVAIVYQSYIDVKVCDIEKASDSTINNLNELTVELTPMYRVVATKKDNVNTDTDLITEGVGQNAVVIQEGAKLDNVPTKNYEVKLALPSNLDTAGGKLSIKHTKGNGSVEYYTGIVSTEGEGTDAKTYVTFTTNGFSPFVIYAASANVASIGEGDNQKVFTTLQAAVDAAQDNDTITLLKDTNENITVSKAVKFTLASAEHLKGTISAGSRYSMTTADVESNTKYTFTYVGGGSSSSGTPTTTYNVNVNAATNGTVAADKKTAAKGTTVTVTVTPSTGYVVDSVKVVDKDGKDVAVTVKDGKYVFTMPGSAVTVTGTFKAETPAPSGLPFVDVKSGDWFYGAVKYAYENGLMTGTSATTFAPNGTMNRAMIVTVLYRLEKSPAVTGASKFTDVPAGQWYSDAVAWAAANNIVNGYDETTFGPMNAVTREQLAAILFRYEQVKGLENVTLEENLNRFPDHDKVSAYAVPALQWAVGQKIINGNADGTLDPTGTATRAQVAQILTNLLSK